MRLCYSIVMFMALLMLVSGLSLISGCGKKGPLYHPPQTQQQVDKQQIDKAKQINPKKTQQP